MCGKRIVVFYPKSTGVITPKLPLLGIQKITNKGTYSIYCADGYDSKDYPAGWLYEVDENGNEKPGTANPKAPDPEKGNLGLFPFGLGLISLPSWLWIVIVIGGLIYLSNENDE